jgi:branched-chain amino acid transport system permease protein
VLDVAGSNASARPPGSLLRRPTAPMLTRAAVIVVLLLFTLLALPQLLSLYYVDWMIQVAVYAMVALGLGVLVGRVGLMSLGQVAVLAVGAWSAARLLFATTQPFPLVLLEAGLATMVLGTLLLLPALRLRGLYLALITLMLAGAVYVVLTTLNFPNGGHGFSGYNGNQVHIPQIRRPSIATSDPAYFRYSVVVAALMFALVAIHIGTKPGRAWAAIRQSEPAALAAGINTTLYKLWAVALASFVTGVAGGVQAGAVHFLYSTDFQTYTSITVLAVVLMGGAYSLWGAIVAALLMQLLPALLNNWGVSNDWLTIIFGIGVVLTLTTAPRGLADQFPKDMVRLGRLLVRLARLLARWVRLLARRVRLLAPQARLPARQVRRAEPVPALPPPAPAPGAAPVGEGEAP